MSPHGTSTDPNSSSGSGPFPAFLFAGMFAFQGVFFFIYALAHFLVVPIILRSERHGVAAGLNVWAAAKMVMADPKTAAVAAILVFLAGIFAGLGIYVCLVGVVFSYGFAAAMLGATVRWYEERSPVQM